MTDEGATLNGQRGGDDGPKPIGSVVYASLSVTTPLSPPQAQGFEREKEKCIPTRYTNDYILSRTMKVHPNSVPEADTERCSGICSITKITYFSIPIIFGLNKVALWTL